MSPWEVSLWYPMASGWARSEVWVSWVEDAIRKREGGSRDLAMLSGKLGHFL